MSVFEVLLIGAGLSMDALAVSITNRMVYKPQKSKLIAMPLFFGGFQALMPLIGYLAGNTFVPYFTGYSGILVFIILGFIGCKMLYDGLRRTETTACKTTGLTYKMLAVQAIATSIDALAVGVGFSSMRFPIIPAVIIIGATTVLCSCAALYAGKRFGGLLGNKAQIFGGVILVLIGIKALF